MKLNEHIKEYFKKHQVYSIYINEEIKLEDCPDEWFKWFEIKNKTFNLQPCFKCGSSKNKIFFKSDGGKVKCSECGTTIMTTSMSKDFNVLVEYTIRTWNSFYLEKKDKRMGVGENNGI